MTYAQPSPRCFLGLVFSAGLASQVPQYTTFGMGCAGSMSTTRLVVVLPPVTGATLQVDLDSLPDDVAVMTTGLSRTTSTFGPLPLRMDPFGIVGPYSYCFGYVSPDSARYLPGSGHRATYRLLIPANPGLIGFCFYQQALVLDANAGNPAGAVMSDAAKAVIGAGMPNMVAIAPGSFRMGSTQGQSVEQPVHTVIITQPFWIGTNEVTQADYQAVMNSNPSGFPGANLPVETVTWNDARNYCATLTAREHAAGRLPFGYQYRLPTEAEWEYCCRAGTATEYGVGNGNSLTCVDATISGCGNQTTVVGSHAPNNWGLHDMHGNVWEWCLDNWDGTANYPTGPVSDPYVGSGPDRVVRGGSWNSNASYCRSARRIVGYLAGPGGRDVGFRVVLARILIPSNMVPVAAGTFSMGSTQGPLNEQPVHSVTITRPFWVGKYEVTQAEYQAVMNSNPSAFPGVDRPVETVTWYDAMSYCATLTLREAAAGRLPIGYEYRLPTEAEWEYCCRAGTTTAFNLGNALNCSLANTFDNTTSTYCIGQTRVVGRYPGNQWGLHDMHGNVAEWCVDIWDGTANYPAGPVSDPCSFRGAYPWERVIRGGAWDQGPFRSAFRYRLIPSNRGAGLGLRVALAPPPVGQPSIPALVPIEAGSFAMGSNQGSVVEQPVHQVIFRRPFWMGRYEVTIAEHYEVTYGSPYHGQGGNLPVALSWQGAMDFCAALTAREVSAGRMANGYQYRLPTEAEWEYGCRAGTRTEWNVGSSLNCAQANSGNCVGQTTAVGTYRPNGWGLHDMHGNLTEWCLDAWDGSANYPIGPVTEPYVATGSRRIGRGGGWSNNTIDCRSAARHWTLPATNSLGFRVVQAPILVP